MSRDGILSVCSENVCVCLFVGMHVLVRTMDYLLCIVRGHVSVVGQRIKEAGSLSQLWQKTSAV